jgi:uncharacterized protein (DUF2336 family)
MPSSSSWLFDHQRRATSVHLFSNELATYDNIRDEVDLGIELPVVCDLANEFLRSVPLPKPQAYEVDETLALLLKSSSPSLKVEVAERLAHVPEGPRRTIRLLAYDNQPAVAVPVLRYSELLSPDEIAAIARLRGAPVPSQDHLAAIASRRNLHAEVTDILMHSGSSEVLDTLAQNDTAQFSLWGLCRMATRAYRDCAAGDGRLSQREWSI